MTVAQHLNPFHVRRVVLTTALPASACVERLRADLAPFWAFWATKQPMKGRANEERFSCSRWLGSRKALPSEARGSFVAGGMGTRVELAIGWRRVDLIGLSLAVLFLIAFSAVLATEEVRAGTGWVPALMAGVFVLVLVLHRMATFHDDDWLVDHLRQLFDATEIPELS